MKSRNELKLRRFPRLAEKAGYDEELHRRNATLAAGENRVMKNSFEFTNEFIT